MRMTVTRLILLATLAFGAQQAIAQEVATATVQERTPLSVEIIGPLSFSRVILGNQPEGSVTIDPATGNRIVAGGLKDGGGLSLRGRAKVKGEPFSAVVISFPNRVEMRSTSGAIAQLVGFETNVSGVPVLDGNGELIFDFGGRMEVKGRISGAFRATIPISVSYP
jgi:Domain of unknown function (DUF4402)